MTAAAAADCAGELGGGGNRRAFVYRALIMNVARRREITVLVLSFPTDVKFQLALEIEHPEMKELTDIDYMPNRMRYKRRARMCTFARTCNCTCAHTQTHRYIHTETHTHTHTHTYTHTYIRTHTHIRTNRQTWIAKHAYHSTPQWNCFFCEKVVSCLAYRSLAYAYRTLGLFFMTVLSFINQNLLIYI